MTAPDREALALVIGSANPRTRHVYIDGNDACLPAADVVLASDWLSEYVARHVRAEFASFGLCPECGGKAAGCAAARIACCPDCKHTAEQLQAAIT